MYKLEILNMICYCFVVLMFNIKISDNIYLEVYFLIYLNVNLGKWGYYLFWWEVGLLYDF